MRIAYADLPYPGQARKHYKDDPNCAEVDHADLIRKLQEYDGWALSTGSTNLQEVIALCPPKVRVGAWVKPLCFYKPGVAVAYAWEPVIFQPARKRPKHKPTIRDYVVANATMKKGTHGAKPEPFCWWLFEVLGMEPEDIFFDLYPGSGAVSNAHRDWTRYALDVYGQNRLALVR